MVFTPSHGLWSRENFDSAVGFTGSDLSLQSVTGGYAGLIPQVERSVTYLHPWAAISGWQVNNTLNNQTVIEADFLITGGRVNASDTATGRQTTAGAGGMWKIFTPPLAGTQVQYSGQTFEYVSLESGSPFSGYHYRMSNSSDSFIVEFDVASHNPVDNSKLIGVTGGHLTGLPALTGKVNHGLYISNGPNWDFLECRPDGIRSLNHPEIQLPFPIKQPTRFRVGVRNNDLFILHENGQAVAGLGKFDAVSSFPNQPIIAFGAPLTGHLFSFSTDVKGFEGESYWDNFKLLMGKLMLDTPDRLENAYTTDTQSLYTPPFVAGANLREWSSACINYLPKDGGITEIVPQYLTNLNATNTTGWQSVESARTSLPADKSVVRISLADVPAGVPGHQTYGETLDLSRQSINSTIRFKIDQWSLDGKGPAPLVDAITVQGFKSDPYLETVPDWKPVDREADIALYIRTDKYLRDRMEPKGFSTFFFRSPSATGVASGSFTSLSTSGQVGSIVGTGQIVGGPWDTAFQNYSFTTGHALSGTAASNLFGSKPVDNFAPDPRFDGPFRDASAMANHVNGYTYGQVGKYIELHRDYTGQVQMEFIKHPVHRLGSSTTTDHAQKVRVINTPYENTCGLELDVPAGITQTGTQGVFRFKLKTESVDSLLPPDIVVYATGDTHLSENYLSGVFYTGAYRSVSVPVEFMGSGSSRIGIVASGNRGNFIVDDFKLAPITTAHLTCDNVHSFKVPFGVIGRSHSGYADVAPAEARRGCTVVSTDLFLDLYPTGSNTLIKKTRYTDGKGFDLYLNAGGNLICDFDLAYDALLSGGYDGTYASLNNFLASTGEVFYRTESITSELAVPLGRWVNVGFIHEAHAYRRYGGRTVSGQSGLCSIAASNRAFLTVDGLPVASLDTMTGWKQLVFSGYTGLGQNSADVPLANPLPTYICDGGVGVTGKVSLASGLYCKLDNVNISKPPSADAESALYIDAARVGLPYFSPDVMLKPGGVDQVYWKNNALSNTTTGDVVSPGMYAQSIWNLDNPGPLTNWDHGANRNHLLFYGSVNKMTGLSPYEGFGSTRFASGSYAKAPYSSSFQRMVLGPDDYTNLSPLWPDRGELMGGAWVYARGTGHFFELVEDEDTPNAAALCMQIVSSTEYRLLKRDGSAVTWSETGTLAQGSFFNEWHHVGFHVLWSGAQDGLTSNPVSGFLTLDGTGISIGEGTSTTGFYKIDAGVLYKGAAGDGNTSALFLGRDADVNLADVFLATNPQASVTSPIMWGVAASATGDKGGVYNAVYYDGNRFTGHAYYHEFAKAVVTLPVSDQAKETTLWAGVNEYSNDEGENLEGVALIPSTSFTEAESYHFKYDGSVVDTVFGGIDSPIRVGFLLPEHAIGLARIDSPSHTVPGTITTIDLSDKNPSNLTTFRNGQFTLSKKNTTRRGRLIQRDSNGSFERHNSNVSKDTFNNLGQGNLANRAFSLANLQFQGWSIQGAENTLFGADVSYDVIPGSYAGTGAGGTELEASLPVTGGFIVSPSEGLHALGMMMASGHDSTGVVALHTQLGLSGGKEHLFTMAYQQPYYPGNAAANLTATVVAISGNLSVPLGVGVVAYWDTTGATWQSGAPNGYGTEAGAMAPNLTATTDLQRASFTFTTTGFPHEGPTDYALWIALTGSQSLAANEPDIDFVMIDEAHVYEIVTTDASGAYQGINSGQYSGQFDFIFKEQVDTDDLRVTSLAVADPELDAPAEAYYGYLLGRGDYALSIPDAFPHSISGGFTVETRSGLADNYVTNIENIKKRIEIRTFDGKPIEDFTWDIVSSPYGYNDLRAAVRDGKDIYADGVGSGQYTGYLPDGKFSVVMISPDLPSDGNTVFVHFPAYNLDNGRLDPTHREIYNPIPVMRESLDFEVPLAGQYSTVLDRENQKFFNVTVYGVQSGYSGNF